jgi:hypothetical protein
VCRASYFHAEFIFIHVCAVTMRANIYAWISAA